MVAIKDKKMPKSCVTYNSENDNYTGCPFYKICEQRETIKTNYKPTDCPLVEIEEHKIGEWVIDDEEHGRIWHCHCSNCKKDPQDYIGGSENWWLVRLPSYCPNCGSKNERC